MLERLINKVDDQSEKAERAQTISYYTEREVTVSTSLRATLQSGVDWS